MGRNGAARGEKEPPVLLRQLFSGWATAEVDAAGVAVTVTVDVVAALALCDSISFINYIV